MSRKRTTIWIILLSAMFFVLSCGGPKIQRVTVAYPEQWAVGEYKNCAPMNIKDVVTNLPFLDCDEQSRDTPRSRMLTMDVAFSGVRKPGSYWTCQRLETDLSCKN
jgi:hypothetical protein